MMNIMNKETLLIAIDGQLKVLRTYPNYNHKHAVKLNQGSLKGYYDNLCAYEDKLSNAQMKAVDNKHVRNYQQDESMDDAWSNLIVDMENEGLI